MAMNSVTIANERPVFTRYSQKQSLQATRHPWLSKEAISIYPRKIEHFCDEAAVIPVDNKEIQECTQSLLQAYAKDYCMNDSDVYRRIIGELKEQFQWQLIVQPSKLMIKNAILGIRGLPNSGDLLLPKKPPFDKVDRMQDMAIILEGHVFIDATFKVTLHPFMQLLIVIGHDKVTDVYVLCACALMTGCTEWHYLQVLQEIVIQIDYNWEPKHVTCNFKKALLKAINREFPET
ncbi:hypothetical protein MXB_3672, partial [Myxobolus squamalis]